MEKENKMNVISVVGNLTEDAQVKAFNIKTRDGTDVEKKFCAFKVADNLSGTTEHTNFFDCVYVTNGAEKFVNFLKKGTQVTLINSTLKIKTSQSKKDDKWYTNVTLNVRDIALPPKPKDTGSSQSGSDMPNDEIPF